jgi:hypothetical protein
MKEQLSSGLVAVACVALLAHGAMGASVFFSTIGEVGQGVHPDNPHLHIPPGSTATVYIWATDDQDYDTTIGMNVVSSSPTYAALQGGEVLNPEIFSEALDASLGTRWQDASVGAVTAGQISDMNAERVTEGTGILAANNGTVPPLKNRDLLYDVDAGAFLLASVTVNVSGDFRACPSILSINQEGTAMFVNDGQQIFPHFSTALVNMCPEPSTLLLCLIALGVAGGWRKWGG